jgi:hypothetical protein
MPVESWPTEPTWSIEAAREKLTNADFRRIVRDCLCLWLSPPSNVPRKSLKLFINLPADQVAALIRILAECLPRGLLRELTFSTLEDRTDAAARIVGCHNASAILQGRSVGQSRQVPTEYLFAPQVASAAVGGIPEQQFADWAIERISQSDLGSIERLVAAAEKIQAETAADLLEIKCLLLDTATLKPAAVRPFLKTRDRRQLLIDQPDAMHHVLIWSIDQTPEGATLLSDLLSLGTHPSETTSLYDELQHLAIESAFAGDAERLSRALGATALKLVGESDAQKLWDTTFQSLEQKRQESARTDSNWALPLSVRVLFLNYYGKNISEDPRREEAWSRTSTLNEFETLIDNRVHDDVLARSWLGVATQLSGQEEWPPRVLSYVTENVRLLARTVYSLLAPPSSSDTIEEKFTPLWRQFTHWSALIDALRPEGVPLISVPFVLHQTFRHFNDMCQSHNLPEVQKAIAQNKSLCRQVVAILLENRHFTPLIDPEYSYFYNDAGQEALSHSVRSALLTLMKDGDRYLETFRSALSTTQHHKLKVGLTWEVVDKAVVFTAQHSGLLAYVLERAPVTSLEKISLEHVPDDCLRLAFAKASKNESQSLLFKQCVRRGLRSLTYPTEIQPSVVLEFLDIASGKAFDGNQAEQSGCAPPSSQSRVIPLRELMRVQNRRLWKLKY